MTIKKLIALGISATMVAGMAVTPVFAEEDPAAQFEGLTAN